MEKNTHTRTYTFPRTHRLSGKLAFSQVYDARVRESRGPLMIYAKPNDLGHSRLGISISTRVGKAVRRTHIKRLLRESFRLMQHDLPRGYDLIVVVRPHDSLILAEYQKLMMAIVLKLHRAWEQRSRKGSEG